MSRSRRIRRGLQQDLPEGIETKIIEAAREVCRVLATQTPGPEEGSGALLFALGMIFGSEYQGTREQARNMLRDPDFTVAAEAMYHAGFDLAEAALSHVSKGGQS